MKYTTCEYYRTLSNMIHKFKLPELNVILLVICGSGFELLSDSAVTALCTTTLMFLLSDSYPYL